MKQTKSIQAITLTALFAALTFIGTTIKIPLPTGAFVHLGNAMLLLAILLLGYFKGSLAGGLGFAIFDLLNGYATEAPYFILESFIVGLFAIFAIRLFKNNPTKIWQIIIIGIFTGIGKIIMTQVKNTIVLLIAGSNLSNAFIAASIKLPATLINVVSTIIIVSILYFPLKKLNQRLKG
ncbi:ECF transporter S component [Enterococcus cecorum]|uniref:ECF transporter S component n=1 Tax=Enterococcus cecorum TaxID=44008 RepID=UPI001FAB9A2B|nr:ECF transporter S component [Enterococcus cecorum]MCJ0537886.1 ECF transporter S component [Enterococcus cecorum]MCJ0545293.1 ECF transporter S component [Enterococcus cecorum]MCJ0549997.1 ECF transporter S component [Enterococcus cecorum]MCJ0568196.1 ECF transporter S component [Enterococcus cecorum]